MPYTRPPFEVTDRMLMLVARISEKIGQAGCSSALDRKPYLRKSNRIRSIHSSLAIEANPLSQDEVRHIISGKTVIGPAREIQEVKNAYMAYDMLGRFDPYALSDLKKMHAVMTALTVEESGVFRSGNEGVFRDGKCIFIAPPPHLVPQLMKSLFGWMNEVRRSMPALILSSVFHYEFVFIHPFSDGNGRMARLWQTALLAEWRPIFQYMPIESRIHAFQDEYYGAIAACHSAGRSDLFIEFMLEKIDSTLDMFMEQSAADMQGRVQAADRLLNAMEYGADYSARELMRLMGLKAANNFRSLYLAPALEKGLIEMTLPDRPTSKNQRYRRV